MFMSLEIVSVSKKSKLKKKKDKKITSETSVELNDNLEACIVVENKVFKSIHNKLDDEDKTEFAYEEKALDVEEDVYPEAYMESTKNEIDSKTHYNFKGVDEFELKSNYINKYEEILIQVNQLKKLKINVVKDMHSALNQSQQIGNISIKLYKKAVGGLYDAIQRILLSLNAEDEIPSETPDSITLELQKVPHLLILTIF